MITSPNNPKTKHIRELLTKTKTRRTERLYVIEGVKMFLEAPADEIVEVYVSEHLHGEFLHNKELAANYAACRDKLAGTGYEIVADGIFAKMSDTVTPQGILTVMRMPEYSLEELLGAGSPLLLILENLQDPGNLGTVFRTAEAAGVKGLVLSEGCVDIGNPKVIRSTMGAIFRVPYIYVKNLPEAMALVKKAGITVFAATLTAKSEEYDKKDYRKGTAFVIGNEGNGLTAEAVAAADEEVFIPMEGSVESLNASMAAGILVFEANRQRRRGGI